MCCRLYIFNGPVDENLEKERGLDSGKRYSLHLLSFQTIPSRKERDGKYFSTVGEFIEIVCCRLYIFNGPVDENLEKDRGLDSGKRYRLRLLSFQTIPNRKERDGNHISPVCELSEIVCCRVYTFHCPVDTNLEKERGLDSRKRYHLRLLSFQTIPNRNERDGKYISTVGEFGEIVCCRVYICNCPVYTCLEKKTWMVNGHITSVNPPLIIDVTVPFNIPNGNETGARQRDVEI